VAHEKDVRRRRDGVELVAPLDEVADIAAVDKAEELASDKGHRVDVGGRHPAEHVRGC
jgi:hypothetical protein